MLWTQGSCPRGGEDLNNLTPTPSGESRVLLGGVFLLALALRLLHLAALWRGPFSPSVYLPIDARRHHIWAIDWLNGSWPPLVAFERPPLFTGFLGVIYAAFGPRPLAVLLTQALLGASSCLLVYSIARHLFDDRRVARLASLACAMTGTLVYFDAQVLSASLDVFLGLLVLRLLLLAGRRGGAALWLAAGLAAGVSALNRGAVLLFAPFAFFWVLRLAGSRTAATTRRTGGPAAAALFAAALALAVLPVSWHNARYDRPSSDTSTAGGLQRLLRLDFVPIATNAGINFYLGNHMALREMNRVQHPEHMAIYNRLRLEAMDRGITSFAEANRYLVGRTLSDVARWPGEWLALMGIKLAELVNGAEIPRNTSLYADRADSPVLAVLLWRLGLAFPSGLIIPLGLAGIALARCDWRRQFLVWSALAAQATFVVAFFVTARYRLPMLPLLCIYAAYAGVELFDAWRVGPRARAERLTGVLALLVALANLPIVEVSGSHHWMDHYNLGIALIDRGRRQEAEPHLRRAAQLNPQEARPVVALCDLLLDTDRPAEALPVCTRAIQADPGSAAAHYGLGTSLEAVGRSKEAIRHYRQAARLAPGTEEPLSALRRLDAAPKPRDPKESPFGGLTE